MTAQEIKECKIASVFLKEISKLIFLLVITIPVTCLQIQNYLLCLTEKLILVFFIGTSLLISFKSWHFYFDAILFKNLAKKEFDTKDLDSVIYILFRKQLKNKNLNKRIHACYKKTSFYFVILFMHLFLFMGINIWLLFHS